MGGDEPPVPLTPSHCPSGSNESFQVHEGDAQHGGCRTLCLSQCLRALLEPCSWNRQRVELWVTRISCLSVPVFFWEQISIKNTVSLEENLKKLSSRGS